MVTAEGLGREKTTPRVFQIAPERPDLPCKPDAMVQREPFCILDSCKSKIWYQLLPASCRASLLTSMVGGQVQVGSGALCQRRGPNSPACFFPGI